MPQRRHRIHPLLLILTQQVLHELLQARGVALPGGLGEFWRLGHSLAYDLLVSAVENGLLCDEAVQDDT